MPNFPIIDSHVHLWDPAVWRIPWLDDNPAINRKLELPDYDEATAGLDIEALVYLEVDVARAYSYLEARAIHQLGDTDKRVAAVIPWAPLEFGERARLYLEELVKIGPRIKGVRRIVQGESDPAFCLQPDFIRGNQMLAEFGLSSDLCCNYRQLAQNVELVRQCPETQFIMDHIAKPDIRSQMFQPWASQMRDLASLPNVVCKISGVVTEAKLHSWTLEEIKPFVLHCLDVFGEDRVVFGSDWSVVTLGSTYMGWVEALDALTVDLSDAAKRKLWSENARRFYRL